MNYCLKLLSATSYSSEICTLFHLGGALFSSAFFMALMGAFAGAYGAQYIIEKIKTKEAITIEIRNTNAAIMTAFNICTTFISLKKQHVLSLKNDFHKEKTLLEEDIEKFNNDRKRTERYMPTLDLAHLFYPLVPLNVLQKLMFNKISSVGRPLMVTSTLAQASNELKIALEKRNQLVDTFKTMPVTEQGLQEITFLYFGIPFENRVDNSYANCIDIIYEAVDDVIFFSKTLCDDLVAHGNKLVKKSKRDANINEPNFTKPTELGLIPFETRHAEWLTIFVKRSDTKSKQ